MPPIYLSSYASVNKSNSLLSLAPTPHQYLRAAMLIARESSMNIVQASYEQYNIEPPQQPYHYYSVSSVVVVVVHALGALLVAVVVVGVLESAAEL